MTERLATTADAEGLVSLINRAFLVERFFIDADRLNLAEILERLHSGRFLVLEEGPELLACVYLELRGPRAYLGLLSVDPAHQGQGIGSRIMDAAEAYCRREGCGNLDIKVVNLREELPPFYRKRGYVETGTSPLPADQPVKRNCHFVEMSKQL
jgi:GNAT superfamily N-acetyltransferase